MEKNVPRLDCPDKELERTYCFRWWTYRKHIRKTPEGYVVTEFLPEVPWARKYNTINCPAGHQFREGRWLHDSKILSDYARFYFGGGGKPRQYSFWAADSVLQFCNVTGDHELAVGLLDQLVENYREWEKARLLDDGLFWQIDDRDGMELSIGGGGKWPLRPPATYRQQAAHQAPDSRNERDWCRLENIFYRAHKLTIQWDRTGEKYRQGAGFGVFADGKLIGASETPGKSMLSYRSVGDRRSHPERIP